jgi:hypothetical protein
VAGIGKIIRNYQNMLKAQGCKAPRASNKMIEGTD